MKRIVFLWLLVLPVCMHAQSFLLQFELPEPPENIHYDRLYTITDTAGSRVIAISIAENLLQATEIRLPECSVLHSASATIQGDRGAGEYQGATINGDTLTVLMMDDRTQLHLYSFVFESGLALHSVVSAESRDERLLCAFVSNNRICYLRQKEIRNEQVRYLQLNSEQADGTFKSIDYTFARDPLREHRLSTASVGLMMERGSLVPNNYLFKPATGWNYYLPSIVSGISHVKVYDRDSLLLVVEDYDDATLVMRMNKNTGSGNKVFYPHLGLPAGAAWVDCASSFLCENDLFQVKANQEKMVISVSSIVSGEMKKTFVFSADKDPFPYRSPLTEAHQNLLFTMKNKSVADTAAFLKKLKDNPVLIAAKSMYGQVVITAGARKIDVNSGTYGSRYYLSAESVYFYACLDKESLENAIPHPSIARAGKALSEAIAGSHVKVNLYSMFSAGDMQYICLYNQRSSRLYIRPVPL